MRQATGTAPPRSGNGAKITGKAMLMNPRRKRKIVTAAAALTGAMVLFPTPAWADNSAVTGGVRATFASQGEIFRLYDTACDGNPVYLKYWFGGKEYRLGHSGGCGTHATWNLDLPESKIITFQACLDIRPGFDRCSGKADDIT